MAYLLLLEPMNCVMRQRPEARMICPRLIRDTWNRKENPLVAEPFFQVHH